MNNKNSLVVYFSRADENYNVGTLEVGNTELLAKEIIAKTGADEFKIEPKNQYPKTIKKLSTSPPKNKAPTPAQNILTIST